MGALSIAVAGSILGTSLVARVLGHTTISGHLDEVDGAVKATGEVRHVDVKGEFLVLELEDVVGGVAGHKVDTGTNVGTGDELQCESVTAGGDAVGAGIVSTIERAVLGTCSAIRAQGGVPSVAGVAVSKAGRGVEPAPVRVEDDGCLCGRTATALRAFLRGEFGMGFCHVRADLLCAHRCKERKRDESDGIRPG